MKTYQTVLATISIMVVGLGFSSQVYAQEAGQSREQRQQAVSQAREQNQQIRQQNIAERCEIVTTRVNTLTSRYEEGRVRYADRYSKLLERLNNLVTKLNDKELSTENLSGYISEIQTLKEQFDTQIISTMSLLNESKDLVCGQSEGAYVELIQQARAQLAASRSTAAKINSIFLTSVVNELKAIRASVNN